MKHDPTSTLTDVLKPLKDARGLPNAHYTDPETFKHETEVLLFGQWAGIGFAADIPNTGDAMPIDVLGVPLLAVRTEDGVRVYQNICRHRGMVLVQEKANIRGTIRCPYHSWCYGLDGALRATPHVGGPGNNLHDGIKRDELGLIPVASHIFRDVIFVNVDGKAPAFEIYAAKLLDRWSEHERTLYPGGPDSAFSLDVATNWKLAVENFCESYHLPWIHPGLNSYSRLEDHYHIEEPGAFAGQGTYVYRQIEKDGAKFPDFDGLSEFWNEGAEYISFFPNVLFGAQRDHAYAMILMPTAIDRTLELTRIYYSAETATDPALSTLDSHNAKVWKEIFEEDIFVVEGMQRGRKAPGFDGGKFSPVMDNPTHVFHHWVATELIKARHDT